MDNDSVLAMTFSSIFSLLLIVFVVGAHVLPSTPSAEKPKIRFDSNGELKIMQEGNTSTT